MNKTNEILYPLEAEGEKPFTQRATGLVQRSIPFELDPNVGKLVGLVTSTELMYLLQRYPKLYTVGCAFVPRSEFHRLERKLEAVLQHLNITVDEEDEDEAASA